MVRHPHTATTASSCRACCRCWTHMGKMEMIAAGNFCELFVRDDCGSIHDFAGRERESSHGTFLNRVMRGTARALELTRPHKTCCTRLALPLTWTTAAYRRLETCPLCWERRYCDTRSAWVSSSFLNIGRINGHHWRCSEHGSRMDWPCLNAQVFVD